MSRLRPDRVVVQTLVSLTVILSPLCGPSHALANPTHATASYPPLVVWDQYAPPYVRHFNPLQGLTAQPGATTYTIYESLYLVDDAQFKQYPWLATTYTWSKDLKTLTFTIRHGVRWSDGQPFSAQDVYYTFVTLAKKYPAADFGGLWVKGGPNEASSVTMPAADQIAITFKTVDTTRFSGPDSFADQTYILPKHIWSHVQNPMTWANPNPVGTGPFTQVQNFTAQTFDLGKNPYYWKPMDPKFTTLRIVGFTSNDAGNLALEAGQIDWAGSIIPNVQKVYVARNPQLFHAYAAPSTAVEVVYPNATRYPYNLVAFRKALSMAINRQAINQVAFYGTAPPEDATGLPVQLLKDWRDPSLPNTLTQYNPTGAHALLESAGFTWQNGHLIDPKGHPVAFDFYVQYMLPEVQVEAQNFEALGIDVTLVNTPTPNYDRLLRGTFDITNWSFQGGGTPYNAYYPTLTSDGNVPIGTATTGQNYERWTNPAMDTLFREFRTTIDPTRQHALANQMERIVVNDLPVIPTVDFPLGDQYSSRNYTGFPTASDNYAWAFPWGFDVWADTLLVLTRVRTTH
jgi:peptide/nickel transport system substrate-binding protein